MWPREQGSSPSGRLPLLGSVEGLPLPSLGASVVTGHTSTTTLAKSRAWLCLSVPVPQRQWRWILTWAPGGTSVCASWGRQDSLHVGGLAGGQGPAWEPWVLGTQEHTAWDLSLDLTVTEKQL